MSQFMALTQRSLVVALTREDREIGFSVIKIVGIHITAPPQIEQDSQKKLFYTLIALWSQTDSTLPFSAFFGEAISLFRFVLYFIVFVYRITFWGSTVYQTQSKKKIRRR